MDASTHSPEQLALDQDWPFLVTLLAADLDTSARAWRALLRRRGVPDATALLRLALVYGYGRLSLRGTALWAREAGVARLSEVALLKRLKQASPWLGHLLATQLAARAGLRPAWPGELRVRLMDATSVTRPGSKGTDWRLHFEVDLGRLAVTQVEVTDARGGETFKRSTPAPGEIVLGDRGYAQRQGIAAVRARDAQVLVRLNWATVPLEQADGQPFDLWAALATVPAAQPAEWAVRTRAAADGTPAVVGRLVALRKSPAAAEAAQREVRRSAQRHGKTPDARSLTAAAYVLVFTTVAATTLTAAQVLELYRFRWQIELHFKRLKSLGALDELAAHDPALCRSYLLAQLLAHLLIEDLSHRWVDFSPWGYGPPPAFVPLADLSGRGGDGATSHWRSVDGSPMAPGRADNPAGAAGAPPPTAQSGHASVALG
jgi:hypothetical protein